MNPSGAKIQEKVGIFAASGDSESPIDGFFNKLLETETPPAIYARPRLRNALFGK